MNTYLFRDIYLGLRHSFDVVLSEQMLNSFLEISGDNNPLHTDIEYAKSKGFVGKVVYGLLTSAFYSTLVGVHLPGKYSILHGINIQFSNPVFINDHLRVNGEVVYMNEAYKQIEVKAFIANQNGKKISKAVIKIGLING